MTSIRRPLRLRAPHRQVASRPTPAAPTTTASSGTGSTSSPRGSRPRCPGCVAARRRRHGPAAGARLRPPGRARLVRQEHDAHQQAARQLLLPRRRCSPTSNWRPTRRTRRRTAAPAPPASTPARRRRSPSRASSTPAEVHQLPDHRAARRRSRRSCARRSATGCSAATSARTCARGTARPRPARSPSRATRRWRRSTRSSCSALTRPSSAGGSSGTSLFARTGGRGCCGTRRSCWGTSATSGRCRRWSGRLTDEDEVIRDAAAWAIERIRQRTSRV